MSRAAAFAAAPIPIAPPAASPFSNNRRNDRGSPRTTRPRSAAAWTRSVRRARAADVVGDRDQPVLRRPRLLSGPDRPVGVEERRLRDVLRVGRVAEDGEDVLVDVANVPLVEAFEESVAGVVEEDGCGHMRL